MSDTSIVKVHDLEWYADVPRSISKQTKVGLLLIAITFGGFGTWAFTAPLAAAIIAQGSFVASGQNKIVQHLEGGIIKDLLVSEGDHVRYDQPLIRLDETAAKATERQLFLRQVRLDAIAARLTAEVTRSPEISYPKDVTDNIDDPEIKPIVDSQKLNFEGARNKLQSEIGLLQQNISAFRFRAEGYQQQHNAVQRQLELMKEEYAGKKTLADKGLLRATELKSIQRAMADAEGQIGRLAAEVSETGAEIIKLEQQIQQAEDAYKQAALDQLQNLEGDLDTVREQLRQAQSVLNRVTINAPVAGTIVRMYYHTSGGVIESGKPILEILPSEVPLVIEALISRSDIDNVRVGQSAAVRLSALNRRTTPVLNGQVIYVSADALPDNSGPAPREIYVARISLPMSEIARVHGFTPTPGMPAEVLVQTEERTFFRYLTKPIADSMSRAFMER
ncbi:HlyD family type I secretion periplasmic adaptor subunit [Aminobacter sp. AP02]|uniref:HlyD family type I secretion periplasmic adaptor subunit n=1 Tax=Aminobacter sp. AP02 TaxID=2135737 RepID=UPI000D6B667E|nr:HlyD family type I secretion periplasmic adaptor subunit [Aminobacter sp. AP02]PWK71589.1 HlyD family secretion protein [Aminobacter sp. AP02]